MSISIKNFSLDADGQISSTLSVFDEANVLRGRKAAVEPRAIKLQNRMVAQRCYGSSPLVAAAASDFFEDKIPQYAKSLGHSLGERQFLSVDDKNQVMDDTSYYLKHELQYIMPGILHEARSRLSAFDLFPKSPVLLPPGAQYTTQRGVKAFGEAKLVGAGMKEVPKITLQRQDEDYKSHMIVVGYELNEFDLLAENYASAITGINRRFELQHACGRALAELANELLLFGDDSVKLYSATSHPDAEKVTTPFVLSRSSDPATVYAFFSKFLRETKEASSRVFGDFNVFAMTQHVHGCLMELRLPVTYGTGGGGVRVLDELRLNFPTTSFDVIVDEFYQRGPASSHMCMAASLNSGIYSPRVSYSDPIVLDISPNASTEAFAFVQMIGDIQMPYPKNVRILNVQYTES